jgi:hypothetical protein
MVGLRADKRIGNVGIFSILLKLMACDLLVKQIIVLTMVLMGC